MSLLDLHSQNFLLFCLLLKIGLAKIAPTIFLSQRFFGGFGFGFGLFFRVFGGVSFFCFCRIYTAPKILTLKTTQTLI